MSVIIDNKDFTQYIQTHRSIVTPPTLRYAGKAKKNEGKEVEASLKLLEKDREVNVEDTKYRSLRGVYKVAKIKSKWKDDAFEFEIRLEKV